MHRFRRASCAIAGMLGCLASPIALMAQAIPPAQPSSLVVTVDLASAGPQIPEDFAGVGFEASLLSPDKAGTRPLSPANHALVALIRSLGIKTIRVGGRSADDPHRALPTDDDIAALVAFARAAGARVIYTLPLQEMDPRKEARIATDIKRQFGSDLRAFELGDASSSSITMNPDFVTNWTAAADAVRSAAPGVPIFGPGHDAMKAQSLRSFLEAARPHGLAGLSEHYFPGGDADPDMAGDIGRELLLSPITTERYVHTFEEFGALGLDAQLPAMLDACNGFTGGGVKGVSDTIAQALWGLDLLSWWAQARAAGVVFDSSASVGSVPDGIYSPEHDAALPLAPAVKLFNETRGARVLRSAIALHAAEGATDALNMTVYASLAPDNSLLVTLINKQHSRAGQAPARPVDVIIRGEHAREPYAIAYTLALLVPGDIAATQGWTIGGAPLQSDGAWAGKWKRLAPGPFVVTMQPASAMIVKIAPGLPQAGP